jgi:hypothetical protein
MQSGATFADANAETHDRVAMNAGQPLCSADRTAFGKGGDNSDLFVAREDVHGGNPCLLHCP